jgi:hypothetical protein
MVLQKELYLSNFMLETPNKNYILTNPLLHAHNFASPGVVTAQFVIIVRHGQSLTASYTSLYELYLGAKVCQRYF